MNKFAEWIIFSAFFALIGLMVVLNIEDWARLSGEINKVILLIGTLSTFVFGLIFIFLIVQS